MIFYASNLTESQAGQFSLMFSGVIPPFWSPQLSLSSNHLQENGSSTIYISLCKPALNNMTPINNPSDLEETAACGGLKRDLSSCPGNEPG